MFFQNCMKRKIKILSLLFLLLLPACAPEATPTAESTATPAVVAFSTATLVPTATPRASSTPLPPEAVPTVAPVMVSLTTAINVRNSADVNAGSLGMLNYGDEIQVIGKNDDSSWLQIYYPPGSVSTGWVAEEFVAVAEEDLKKIPIVQPGAAQSGPVAPAVQAATPIPAEQKRTARVKNQIFVRSGPGQTFDDLGVINADTVVSLTGRSQNNVWVQIVFDGGTDGKGWVAAAYLDGADLQGLPYFDNLGAMVSGETPIANAAAVSVTPTGFSPAVADGDSEQNPAAQMKFSPDGAKDFTYTSDLSAPNGDNVDYVIVSPYEPTNQSTYIYFKLECSGNGGVTATLKYNNAAVPDAKQLLCGMYDLAYKVQGGKDYMLVLNADGSGGPIRYTQYTLRVYTGK